MLTFLDSFFSNLHSIINRDVFHKSDFGIRRHIFGFWRLTSKNVEIAILLMTQSIEKMIWSHIQKGSRFCHIV